MRYLLLLATLLAVVFGFSVSAMAGGGPIMGYEKIKISYVPVAGSTTALSLRCDVTNEGTYAIRNVRLRLQLRGCYASFIAVGKEPEFDSVASEKVKLPCAFATPFSDMNAFGGGQLLYPGATTWTKGSNIFFGGVNLGDILPGSTFSYKIPIQMHLAALNYTLEPILLDGSTPNRKIVRVKIGNGSLEFYSFVCRAYTQNSTATKSAVVNIKTVDANGFTGIATLQLPVNMKICDNPVRIKTGSPNYGYYESQGHTPIQTGVDIWLNQANIGEPLEILVEFDLETT